MSPKATGATALRVFAQLRRDPRTVALLMLVPVVLITLLKYMFVDTPSVFHRLGAPLPGAGGVGGGVLGGQQHLGRLSDQAPPREPHQPFVGWPSTRLLNSLWRFFSTFRGLKYGLITVSLTV